MTTLEQNIEGLLFYFGDEVAYTDLVTYADASLQDVTGALETLREAYQDRGIELVLHNNKAKFVTSAPVSAIVAKMQQVELEGELSKAAQEVLSIVLYAGPISKGYIDYVRGVNSTVSVRNLVARGLIERGETAKGQYVATHSFLESLGITDPATIEGYAEMRAKLTAILQHSKKES